VAIVGCGEKVTMVTMLNLLPDIAEIKTYPLILHDTDDTQSSWGISDIFCGGMTDSIYSISRVSS
jgi:hypothetical protein